MTVESIYFFELLYKSSSKKFHKRAMMNGALFPEHLSEALVSVCPGALTDRSAQLEKRPP